MTGVAHKADRTAQARALLWANDRGSYTVPTDRLYPFQWNWDSAFVAMGWATFDTGRAWREIERLLEGQWDDGFIPHIVFHAPSDDYFPGPDVWGTRHMPPTSGITQPPVLATAICRVLAADATPDGEARAAAVYPRLLANHAWWERARDPRRTGLATTLHPWETGMDNSPAWDAALERVPTDTSTPIRRKDTTHVDAAFRPRGIEYQRFIHLVDLFRDVGWNPQRMLAVSPFRIADVGTNAILLRAEQDMLSLAQRFGTDSDRAVIAGRIACRSAAIAGLWDESRQFYLGRDLIADAPIPVRTSAGFLPLFAGLGDHVGPLCAHLRRWSDAGLASVPSTDPDSPAFEPLRYWRGPVWAVVNWMIADGLRRCGAAEQAERVAQDTRRLIADAGWSEYFDPTSRLGIGGGAFSWTAAVDLLLTEEPFMAEILT